MLNEMAALAREQGEDQISLIYGSYHQLLRRCREIGTAAAFAELVSGDSFESSELGSLAQSALEAHEQYRSAGDREALQAAVATWQRVLAHPDFRSAAPRYRSRILNNFGNALLDRYEAQQDLAYLNAALEQWSQAAVLAARGSVERALILRNLGSGYVARYSRTRDLSDLELGIQARQEAVAEIPDGSSYAPAVLDQLGTALTTRFERTGEPGDLERAVDLLQQAVTITADDSHSESSEFQGSALNSLGLALFHRYEAAGRAEDLDAALERWDEAVRLPSTGKRFRSALLDHLGGGYLARHIQTGNMDDLERAIEADEEALAGEPCSSPKDPDRPVNLGNALRVRYDRTGNLSDLERAIEMLADGVAHAPPDSPNLPIVLSSLGGALRTRHERTADPNDLERAIAAFEQAVNSTSPSSPYRPTYLTGVGAALRDRYRRTGQLDDLERAIDVQRQAVTQAPAESPDRIHYQTGLGNALRDRYARNGQLDDLEQAIEAFDQVVAQTQPGSPRLPVFLTNLGSALMDRYQKSGQRDDLDRAISVLEQSVAETPAGSPDLAPSLNGLAGGLLERFNRDDQTDDLQRAIDTVESAVAGTPADSPLMPAYLNNLAQGLRYRYERTSDPDDLQRAVDAYRRSCRRGLDVSEQWQLSVARIWGGWATQRESWDEAVEAYGFASTAMQFLFRTQLTRSHKETWLQEATGLPSHAAYALAMTGNLEGAVIALEEGRALLLSDTLEGRRIDLEDLSARNRPDLRDRYLQAADRLRALDQVGLASGGPALTPAPSGADRRRARAELDAVIAEIRQLAGHERFLDRPKIDDLVAAASAAPLVYLAAAEHGGLALIVSADGLVTSAWLPDISESRLRSEVGRYFEQYLFAQRLASRHSAWLAELDRMTHWLGKAFMEPMLETLSAMPRAVLIPAGLLGLLPLHAAWIEDAASPNHRRYALDVTLLIYAPNGRAIQAAENVAARIPPTSALVVDEPRPVSAAPLPNTKQEVEAVLAFLPGSQRFSHEQATRAVVLDAIAEHPILYFACHGSTNPVEPLLSFLLLANDERLTLHDILEQRVSARLAVLSACDTAVSGVALPDEVISFPTSLLQAGLAGAIGSLWSVPDLSTMALMIGFFEHWRRDGLEPADALRCAQQWIRDATNGEKQAAFPDVPALAAPAGSAATRAFWASARAHEHPYHWAAFTYVGV
jgi:tetratricopeptide (TPR) repeat protein